MVSRGDAPLPPYWKKLSDGYKTAAFPVRFTYFAPNITLLQDFHWTLKKWDGNIWHLLIRKTNIIIDILNCVCTRVKLNLYITKDKLIKTNKNTSKINSTQSRIIIKIVIFLQNTYLLNMLISVWYNYIFVWTSRQLYFAPIIYIQYITAISLPVIINQFN